MNEPIAHTQSSTHPPYSTITGRACSGTTSAGVL